MTVRPKPLKPLRPLPKTSDKGRRQNTTVNQQSANPFTTLHPVANVPKETVRKAEAAPVELEAAQAELKAQEDAYNNKTQELTRKSETLEGVVARNKVKFTVIWVAKVKLVCTG